ncbi:MAG TPA: hypothetical protein DDW23_06630 [Planctomycetes bacterium]|nr:hypothetical protein [Planctomycetota bacterium]|tara:strand:+ start:853 stop:1842 length:990 start_codon:yes stop_codon:yes gene_type:complete
MRFAFAGLWEPHLSPFGGLAAGDQAQHERFLYGCNLQPGSRLGGCVLHRVLEEGVLGVVWLAEQRHPQRKVAIKVLRRNRVDSSSLDQFQLEASRLASLDHPALVQVYDLGSEGHVHYLIREYVEGGRLDRIIADGGHIPGPMPYWAKITRLVGGLSDGLSAAHERGVLHRALWSGNVVVDGQGMGRLIDFCMSKDSGSLEIPSVRRFLPAERLAGLPADEKTDVYGLGMILLHALSRSLPPVDAALHLNRRATRRLLRQGREYLPHGLEAVCLDAVAKDPDRRIPNAREFSRRLSRVLSGSLESCRFRTLRCAGCWAGKVFGIGRKGC